MANFARQFQKSRLCRCRSAAARPSVAGAKHEVNGSAQTAPEVVCSSSTGRLLVTRAMHELRNTHILLGISGGIAAYKSAEICRRLMDAGAQVRVMMTKPATRFVSPLTFQALSGQPVHSSLWSAESDAGMGHIELARWAQLILIAPATANCMARMATGMADDLLTATLLASSAPVAVAPAMNQRMWQASATRRNQAQLIADGVAVWGPDAGAQACGDEGKGRMIEAHDAVRRCAELLQVLQAQSERGSEPPPSAASLHLVITAGPTREPVDPVRYLSNHSSGKQGFALARAARQMGAQVTLIAGPVALDTPQGVTRVDVNTARQMLTAVREAVQTADIFISAAAVADFAPQTVSKQKIKKAAGRKQVSLALTENPDIVATIAAEHPHVFTVAFAAETENLLDNARSKLRSKGVQLVIANDVSQACIGFNSDENQVTLVDAAGDEALPQMHKDALGQILMERICKRAGRAGNTGGACPPAAAAQDQSR